MRSWDGCCPYSSMVRAGRARGAHLCMLVLLGTNVSIHVGDVLPCAAVLLWLMRCPTPALQKYNRHSRKAEPPGRAGREANGMKPVQNGKAAGSTK